ncbi:putative leader peptide [Streptomyces griseoviridis]|uniref:putative leader peptide n=1 Tax=Streptomyces griseoviridis TaxID=45398 RepID=UPI003570F8CE
MPPAATAPAAAPTATGPAGFRAERWVSFMGSGSPGLAFRNSGPRRPSHPVVRDARTAGFSLTAPAGRCQHRSMTMRLDLTRRRHVDLARVSSAACRSAA